ncbi:hypothetical protein KDK95_31950 [Actinospica sp. MGRD01-02]|uniref:Uncharacterized protein n=1 Tax=Actinospica acidithermotolerans TaxID=2828514 RepID=A0A941EI59_9ACTN|nr:hypothetical protein [Actinospica acidithermotolerans]MBR7830962.1 hypothetical protein [Actinospica acidithermotolerans]
MGMDDRNDLRVRLAGFLRRRRAVIGICAVVLIAVLAVSELRREDDVARRNQLTAQVQYPEAFGAHGMLETCYALTVPYGSQPSAPVATIMDSCPIDPITPYPSATA